MSKKPANGKAKKDKSASVAIKETKKYVDKALDRRIETKMKDIEVNGKTIEGTIDNTHVTDLLPTIARGTGEADRVGNKVNCVKHILRMSIYCYNQAIAVPPIWFDIYIFKTKERVPKPPSFVEMVQFLEDDNVSKQYVGNRMDGLRDLNNELFTIVKHIRRPIFNPLNTTNFIGASSSLNPCRNFKIDLTKHIKKSWVFNDAANVVENDTLYIAIGATRSDGIAPSGVFGDYSIVVSSFYKDA